MSTLSDDEQEAIWDGWAEMYQAQDEALIENGEAWRCYECGALNKDDESLCKECGYAPNAWLCSCGAYIEEACHCSNCGQQAPWGCDCGLRDDIEYMPLWATIAGPLERLHDEWNLESDPEQAARRQALIDGLHDNVTDWGKAIHRLMIDTLNDEWTDKHERDDSEGWDDET